jgi:NAD(P)-dependent dehydrogenase (short-subunit alcohol dehydrogenase family)
MRELDRQSMIEVLTVNAIGPALVAKHFLPRMRKQGKTVFAALSARVGSIGDNRLGGWLSYRASKAALNMLLATLAIEHARSRSESVVVGLHPGSVKSNLSQPFTGNLRDRVLFSPKDAASCLLEVIDSLTSADTGNFLAWDGSRIVY